ncbi:hypothetical protein [Legionella impletisoli]|uniref:Uncharacterized protein n=2 Tax=Legionella impletisoli TaxID=343510 RepID=A0A917NC43_9GAMM|nr:hypothetical protein [Legionella impletisoli]GGI86146.1 hypothetical protein GCM10007966_13450 [Legionella impletisoli]
MGKSIYNVVIPVLFPIIFMKKDEFDLASARDMAVEKAVYNKPVFIQKLMAL